MPWSMNVERAVIVLNGAESIKGRVRKKLGTIRVTPGNQAYATMTALFLP